MLPTLLITLALLTVAFAGIAVKILIKKNGKFSGTCASQNPALNKANDPCGFCGKIPENCDDKN